MHRSPKRIDWVRTARELEEVVAAWPGTTVGFDSEFIRVRTFYPEAALYQSAVDDAVLLIDPIALEVEGLRPMATALADRTTLFVMHACSEDLELLRHQLGTLPCCLFDTQIAASLCLPEPSLGYQALVRRLLNVEVDKSETRSDWRKRPLSESQVRYAADDVLYLGDLQQALESTLLRLGRLDWLVEEMHGVLDAAANERQPEDYYANVRDAWRLDAGELAVFKALCTWRERTARGRDRPRGRIVPDALLLEIARRGLRRRHDIEALLEPPLSDRWAPELEQAIDAVHAAGRSEWPAPLPAPLPQHFGELIKALRAPLTALAESLGVSEAVLASRRLLELLLRALETGAATLPREWQGWRGAVVLPTLRAVLSQPRWRLARLPE